MALGSRLKLARTKRDLSQGKVAELVESILPEEKKKHSDKPTVTQSTIQQIEQRDSKTTIYAEEIAKVLQIPYQWLTTGSGLTPFDIEKLIASSGDAMNKNVADLREKIIKNNTYIIIMGLLKVNDNGISAEIEPVEPKEVIEHPFSGPLTKAYQIFGGALQRPLKDGWIIIADELETIKQGEPLLLEMKNNTWLFAELLLDNPNSIEVDAYSSAGRKTIMKSDINKIIPVVAIYPPSKIIKI